MARRALLWPLLAVCLVVHVGAYIVQRSNTFRSKDIPKVQKHAPVQWSANSIYSLRKAKPEMSITTTNSPNTQCDLSPEIIAEIEGYQETVDSIIDYVTTGAYKGQVYEHLAGLVDTFGPRMTGTGVLEEAIDYMVQKSIAENLDNVHTEDVQVPHWVRNDEAAWMRLPRLHKLNILGLGSSVATPPSGITAEVLVVTSFDDLKNQSALAEGKIVVFNPPWKSYGETVQYRTKGASEAAKVGAVAALIRSVTPLSIDSPHTGEQYYTVENKIPAACITVEDAAMMERMQARGQKIEVQLTMSAETYPDVTSRNTVAEVLGTQQPDETVLVSGHLDSWDVGQGAMDDGGGMIISWAALVVLQKLRLRPRRTVRAVLWTAEEQGAYGGREYFRRHKDEHEQFQLIMESDGGTFTPQGIAFSGTPEALCIMQEVLKLLHRINATEVTTPTYDDADIGNWEQLGVPTGSLNNDNSHYFWYHHSNGDTLTVEDPDILDRCLALWTSVAYVIADIEERLPHSTEANAGKVFPLNSKGNHSQTKH